MKRLNPETLDQLYKEMQKFLEVRRIEEIIPGEPRYPYHLLICGGTGCHASRSLEIKDRFLEEIRSKALEDKVMVIETGCNGFCAQGPVMVVYPGGVFYQYLKPEDAHDIIEQHCLHGRPVERLLYRDAKAGKTVLRRSEASFFALQNKRVLRNTGLIAAERIEEYIGTEGYKAACKALFEMTPQEIITEVKLSGLRGRGGAGFPTGLKWEFADKSPGNVKYILCNADEGDPGAFMDRSVLEADPHSVLEGMIIGAKAIGAHQGYIYCRAEYPLAVKRLIIAIAQARDYGLLGKDILGSGFDFDLEIYRGAGAFVCGEETALMTSIEGKRGMPRSRPPFPALQGLWKKPSVLNNVETLSSVPQLILKGGAWFAKLGTIRSKGTKIFAVTGDINNVGLVEVPMGTSIGTIIHDIGGGIPKGKKLKAVQLGGPSGGCVPVQHLNTPVDYESIMQLGAIVGSGGMIVMDEDKCVVDVARFFMDFCRDESCGKCTPCRVGTQKMLDILTRICEGKGREDDIERLEKWAEIIKNTALCGLGQTAPNPVLSTIRYFRDEYEAHIREGRCPAVVCPSFFKAPCMHACPIGMDIPGYIALVKEERLDDAYRVLLRTNPFPSICGRVCDHQCESKCRRSTLDEPLNIKSLKRFITDHGSRPPVQRAAVTRKERVGVIGAGPSGLTAAKDLALRGYAVSVFDALPEAGGMLRWGIPEYRLPRDVLKKEIQDILDLGVELRLNTRVGDGISWAELRRTYDALYIAIGAQRSAGADLAGGDLKGVCGAVEFLRDLNLEKAPLVGERVAVIGGGNSAVDASRSALRLGARKVTLLYRRRKEDMPAQEDEIRAAEEEGIEMRFLSAPLRIEGNGRVERIVCQTMTLGDFDSSGRRRPVAKDGSLFSLDVDQVILAIGQEVDLPPEKGMEGISLGKNRLIEIKKGTRTETRAGLIFAGGDAVTGPATVVGAIAAGHLAALEIDRSLSGGSVAARVVSESEQISIPVTVEEQIHESARACMAEASCAERIADFREVELGLSKEDALKESQRCLRCDVQAG